MPREPPIGSPARVRRVRIPHVSGNIVATTTAQHDTHSVRMRGTGPVLDPITLTCAFGRQRAPRGMAGSAHAEPDILVIR